MTFLALLTKELRLRLRRERTIWIIILYIMLMGLLSWFYISRSTNYNGYSGTNLSDMGTQLYLLLSMIQLFMIMFITPAFTATAINGEKERQTFDLLLCSRLSPFSLLSGKLLAGLVNALLLIAASIPLFSLVFFFGGISPQQVLIGLLVFVMTTLVLGTLGIFCSTLVSRPALSTSLAYMTTLLWLLMPLVLTFIAAVSYNSQPSISSTQPPLLLVWNPVIALYSTYSQGSSMGVYSFHNLKLAPWLTFTLLDCIAVIVLFLLSMWMVRPDALKSLLMRRRRQVSAQKAATPAP